MRVAFDRCFMPGLDRPEIEPVVMEVVCHVPPDGVTVDLGTEREQRQRAAGADASQGATFF